jgi:hypothetical protein
MDRQADDCDFARFDVNEIVPSFPGNVGNTADRHLTDQPAASARVFRFYRPTPLHYHEHSDEYPKGGTPETFIRATRVQSNR